MDWERRLQEVEAMAQIVTRYPFVLESFLETPRIYLVMLYSSAIQVGLCIACALSESVCPCHEQASEV